MARRHDLLRRSAFRYVDTISTRHPRHPYIGITPANPAVLKNGRATAVRLTTLAALCG